MAYLILLSLQSEQIETVLASLPNPPIVKTIATPEEIIPLMQAEKKLPYTILWDGRDGRDIPALFGSADQADSSNVRLISLRAIVTSQALGERAIAAGADGYIIYPLSAIELETVLKRDQDFWQMGSDYHNLRQRALDNERLATIGRMTASMVHSISNPMQAMRGALILAKEDSDSPSAVEEYIQLTQQELARVAQVVDQMRALYRPSTNEPVVVHTPDLVRDIFTLAREEAMRQKVRLQDKLSLDMPPIQAVPNQLQLVLLHILLNLIDVLGEAGGGEITATGRRIPGGKGDRPEIEWRIVGATLPVDALNTDLRFGASPTLELLKTNHGGLEFLSSGENDIVVRFLFE